MRAFARRAARFLLLLNVTASSVGDSLLLETGDYILLETGDKILKE